VASSTITLTSKRIDPPRLSPWRIDLGLAALQASKSERESYAAALLPVGTDAIVFKI
jgi:hypothetical protein